MSDDHNNCPLHHLVKGVETYFKKYFVLEYCNIDNHGNKSKEKWKPIAIASAFFSNILFNNFIFVCIYLI